LQSFFVEPATSSFLPPPSQTVLKFLRSFGLFSTPPTLISPCVRPSSVPVFFVLAPSPLSILLVVVLHYVTASDRLFQTSSLQKRLSSGLFERLTPLWTRFPRIYSFELCFPPSLRVPRYACSFFFFPPIFRNHHRAFSCVFVVSLFCSFVILLADPLENSPVLFFFPALLPVSRVYKTVPSLFVPPSSSILDVLFGPYP